MYVYLEIPPINENDIEKIKNSLKIWKSDYIKYS